MNNRNLEYDMHTEAPKSVRLSVTCTGGHGPWGSPALKIAWAELNNARDYVETVEGLLQDAMQQVEDADKASEPHEIIFLQFSDTGENIRKWSRTPFEGARKCRVAIEQVSA